jgi:hypothetical protein
MENLVHGIEALAELGLEMAGLRPPGGQLGDGGVEILRKAGIAYASPAGEGAGVEDDIALLPFQWRHVDASCLLPPLAPVREQMTGSPDPLDPETFVTFLEGEIERVERDDDFTSIVLHLPLLDWLGEDNLDSILSKLASTQSWLARCGQAAEHVLAHPEVFTGEATLDSTSWA